MPPKSTIPDFWKRVKRGSPDECWPWQGYVGNTGYGQLNFQGKLWNAHVLSYELTYGPKPEGKNFICHHCDNRLCCNPAHLFAGDVTDNNRDMLRKKRHGSFTKPGAIPHGEDHFAHRLTDVEVREIRRRHASGETAMALGREYGVSNVAVKNAVDRKTWKHVE